MLLLVGAKLEPEMIQRAAGAAAAAVSALYSVAAAFT